MKFPKLKPHAYTILEPRGGDICDALNDLVERTETTGERTFLLFNARLFEAYPGEDMKTIVARQQSLYAKKIEPL